MEITRVKGSKELGAHRARVDLRATRWLAPFYQSVLLHLAL
jgi:hypothetical protein